MDSMCYAEVLYPYICKYNPIPKHKQLYSFQIRDNYKLGFLYLSRSITSIMSTFSIDLQARHYEAIYCYCGAESQIWVSSKPKSRGWKFYGCLFYEDKSKYRGFSLYIMIRLHCRQSVKKRIQFKI